MPNNLSDLMKQGMRQWVSGVAIITTLDENGRPHAMTASSFTSVSDSPASILVCINKSARMANSLHLGKTHFCANLLSVEHEALSNLCATPDAYDQRFNQGDWDVSRTPRLNNAAAVFECVVDQLNEYGTHYVVIGRVLDVAIDARSANPLCYWDGRYRQLTQVS